jgi:hypothetical protein
VADRYWSREEVEALIPTLTEIMSGVMKGHAEASALRQRFQEEKQRIALSGGAMIDVVTWRDARANLERFTEEVRAGLERIAELGGVVKDLDMGLVDFVHRRDAKDVNLCWKYGETEIRFWHGMDEGYAARKPL